jgi:hypothetical protein
MESPEPHPPFFEHVSANTDFSRDALRSLAPEMDCSSTALRALAPKRIDTIAGCASHYLSQIITYAKRGATTTKLYHSYRDDFASLDPIDTNSVTRVELLEYLTKKCVGCTITWKPYKCEYQPDKDIIEITVNW